MIVGFLGFIFILSIFMVLVLLLDGGNMEQFTVTLVPRWLRKTPQLIDFARLSYSYCSCDACHDFVNLKNLPARSLRGACRDIVVFMYLQVECACVYKGLPRFCVLRKKKNCHRPCQRLSS